MAFARERHAGECTGPEPSGEYIVVRVRRTNTCARTYVRAHSCCLSVVHFGSRAAALRYCVVRHSGCISREIMAGIRVGNQRLGVIGEGNDGKPGVRNEYLHGSVHGSAERDRFGLSGLQHTMGNDEPVRRPPWDDDVPVRSPPSLQPRVPTHNGPVQMRRPPAQRPPPRGASSSSGDEIGIGVSPPMPAIAPPVNASSAAPPIHSLAAAAAAASSMRRHPPPCISCGAKWFCNCPTCERKPKPILTPCFVCGALIFCECIKEGKEDILPVHFFLSGEEAPGAKPSVLKEESRQVSHGMEHRGITAVERKRMENAWEPILQQLGPHSRLELAEELLTVAAIPVPRGSPR